MYASCVLRSGGYAGDFLLLLCTLERVPLARDPALPNYKRKAGNIENTCSPKSSTRSQVAAPMNGTDIQQREKVRPSNPIQNNIFIGMFLDELDRTRLLDRFRAYWPDVIYPISTIYEMSAPDPGEIVTVFTCQNFGLSRDIMKHPLCTDRSAG